jgi:hypothetical protein
MPTPPLQKLALMLSRKTTEGKENDMVDLAFHNEAEKHKAVWFLDFLGHVAVEQSHGTKLKTSIKKAIRYYPGKLLK